MREDDNRSEEDLPKEKVTVFDDSAEEWEGKYHRNRHEGNTVWGIIFIAAGVMFLLNTLNLVPWRVWDHIWQFWPVLLIFWGLQILFGQSLITRILVNVICLAVVVLIVLFAISEVDPKLLSGLPPDIFMILAAMKGIQK